MLCISRMLQSVLLPGKLLPPCSATVCLLSLCALMVMHIDVARAIGYADKAAFMPIESCCRLTRERDEARSTMESAVAAARAAGPVPNGAAAMEEDTEPPAKRVSLLCRFLWLMHAQQ